MQTNPNPDNLPLEHNLDRGPNRGLRSIIDRVTLTLARDTLVQHTTDHLRLNLEVDRVVLYYFFRPWEGRVTFQSLSSPEYSILGSTGPDQCFNEEYAEMYLKGRVRAIEDVDQEPIADCHRRFLAELGVKSNLVVPVLTQKRLWGLLVAHHCESTRHWSEADVILLQSAARTLATAPSIRTS